MIVFPNCKINLGLHITGKRNDGYHNIATVFYPVPIKDALEIIHTSEPGPLSQHVIFSQSGIPVDGEAQSNLCVKAWELLKKDFPDLPAIQLHLHKAIPMGAGLGGGSADGALTLLLLNEKFSLKLSREALLAYSLQLGSDCPFFIINQPCIASGRGEILEELPTLSLAGYRLVIVNPGIHINTGWAFTQLTISPVDTESAGNITDQLKAIIAQPVTDWKHVLINDFEKHVFEQYPAIADIKTLLYEKGALYASMSGSGSTVYGIFRDIAPDFGNEFPTHYLVQSVLL